MSVSPTDGASGISAEAFVILTFSEPMDPDAVQTAYSSTDLPSSMVDFRWSAGDTVLQITPKQPLTIASGTNPSTTEAKSYAFAIGTTAVDKGGEALRSFRSSFTTLRQIEQTLDSVKDINLTGNWRSDDTYGNNSCISNPTTCIGDSSNDNSTYRGFVTFDLSGLPPIQTISSAQLHMDIATVRNAPFADLGSLLVDDVSFDSISLVAFDAAAIGVARTMSSSAAVGAQLSVEVGPFVQADLPAQARSQFRLRFSADTNSDGEGDLIEVSWASEQLTLTYLAH